MRTYTGKIKELADNQIFVFGSNTQGRHGKGAALVAKLKFGAIQKQPFGFQGKCYAICTKDLTKKKHPSVKPSFIKVQIAQFYSRCRYYSNLEFMIAYLAGDKYNSGYTDREMAEMFNSFPIPENVIFEDNFADLIIEIQNRHQRV